MSLHYGYDVIEPEKKLTANYTLLYSSISTSYRGPSEIRTGYSSQLIYGEGINSDTKFTLLTHNFDRDGIISGLKLRYKLTVIKKNDTTQNAHLADVSMAGKRIDPNSLIVYVLGETFTISDYIQDYDQIVVFYISYKKLSGTATGGNESNINVRVEY